MLTVREGALRRSAALAAGCLFTVLLVGPARPARGVRAARPQGTIVFASDRSGTFQIYSIRADGSQLGQLTRGRAADTAPLFSPDGRRIVFNRGESQLWVMDADGSGQRRLASPGYRPSWSPDSRRIVYAGDRYAGPLVLVGVHGGGRIVVPGRNSDCSWSPDGRLIAFLRRAGDRLDLMVVGRDGRGLRTIRRNVNYGAALGFGWSPRGQITYFTWVDGGALVVIGPDGRGARRLLRGPINGLAWSPDGRRFAFVRKERLQVASATGRGVRDITPKRVRSVDSPAWSPDGRWVAVRSRPPDAVHYDLLVVAADGASSRAITKRIPHPWGSENGPPSWRPRGATPARLGGAPVAPLPSETVSASAFRPVGTGTVRKLAADGGRVAIITDFGGGCAAAEVWEPARRRVVRFQGPCGVGYADDRDGAPEVALAGTRVAWLSTERGNYLYTRVVTATLARRAPIWIGSGAALEGLVGDFAGNLAGHGTLLAFTVKRSCDSDSPSRTCPPGRRTGDIVGTTLWRFGGQMVCPEETQPPIRQCSIVTEADGELRLLAVDAERIAVSESGVRLLTSAGAVLRDFAVSASAAALSGNRLAVRTVDAVEVYDANSGALAARFPVPKAVRLEDLEGDILVTASGETVTLRGLGVGRTVELHTNGPAKAELEQPGLFLAGAHRVTFTPMQDVLRRLGG
jgi:TolB protein